MSRNSSSTWHTSRWARGRTEPIEPHFSEAAWEKSSLSGESGESCVEIAGNLPEVVAVHDSKNPADPTLSFTSGPQASGKTSSMR
ncbi:DUF397 domain-containing protein [Streptosporangium sp. NPDC006930]